MIEIDGAMGEGGGQVLRSALTLSILTGQPTRIKNIRIRRSQPGLMPQHLKAIDAAAAVSKAHVEGAHHGSTNLLFEPAEIRSGRYKFDIGTAGSSSLVLQTIFLPLSKASSASTVIITGGTHVPWAPCYHYLDWHWLEIVKKIGFSADVSLDQAGFYPQGGGRISATIRPANELIPLNMVTRGSLLQIRGISGVANLDTEIAERQKRRAIQRLQPQYQNVRIKIEKMPSKFKGTVLLLLAEFESDNGYAQCCYYSLGQLGKPAERVADEALDAFFAFTFTEAAVDQYLADQLLLPLAIASGESQLYTSRISQHTLTNAEVIRAFLPIDILVQGELGLPGLIRIIP
jgi:RNA 3'-terminal phosphate cyclase (ATP)